MIILNYFFFQAFYFMSSLTFVGHREKKTTHAQHKFPNKTKFNERNYKKELCERKKPHQ